MGLVLIDSSVWIDHLRSPLAELAALLSAQHVLQHPHVTGELALGSIASRERLIDRLAALPQARVVEETSFLAFVEAHQVFGTGLGFVDSHLLASASTHGARVWSSDRGLEQQALRLGLAHRPGPAG